jgi:hypothetical protein
MFLSANQLQTRSALLLECVNELLQINQLFKNIKKPTQSYYVETKAPDFKMIQKWQQVIL